MKSQLGFSLVSAKIIGLANILATSSLYLGY